MRSSLPSSDLNTFRLPWTQWRRGLVVAGALSLLLHGLSFNVLNQSFDFKFNERSGSASLNTRVIQATSERDAGMPPTALAKAAQEPPKAAATTSPPETPLSAPNNTQAANAAPAKPAPEEPLEAPDLEQNKQLPGINTAQSATETIASMTPNSEAAAGVGSAAAQPSLAVRLQYPPNAQLEFEALNVKRGQTTSGSGQLSWKSNGGEYELHIESTVLGFSVFSQKSMGKLDTMGLAPERFSDKRVNRSEQAAHFIRTQGVVQFSNNKPEAALLPGMQDRLSVLLQLAGIIGGDPKRYEIVNRIVIPVAGVDAAELWEFSLDKPVDITVPAANMRAIKLVRKPRNEFDQRLEVWLSPQMGYLPIRILQSDEQNPESNFTELSLKRLPR